MKIVLIAPLSAEAVASIAAVDHRVEVIDAWELFLPEIAAEWPPHTVAWYLPERARLLADSPSLREQRDTLLGEADIVCITFPFPLRLIGRAPRVRFVQQLPAGVSNLERGDLWQTHVPVTSGRGAGNTLAIAEWAISAMLALAKNLPLGWSQQQARHLERSAYPTGWQVAGKTMGVVGLGGIGRDVARLGRGLGMRVVGSRRSAEPVETIEQVYPPEQLDAMLGQSDVLVLATQLTRETFQLLGRRAFSDLRRGAFVVNVARGELIDEAALVEALESGQVAGFAADVYAGEFDKPPPEQLLERSDVILTPHVSGRSDHPSVAAVELFCDNVRRCLDDRPLLNLVDWQRGY
jgi:phosphoglycerate dehydrogenase-like enzyme